MKKRILIFLFLFILLASSCFALDIENKAKKDAIFPGEEATFALTILNNGNLAQDIEIKTLSYDWKLIEGEGTLYLPAGVSKTVQLAYQEKLPKNPGFYDVSLIIKSDTERYEKSLSIEVINKTKLLYVQLENKEIDPRRPALFKIKIKNRYNFEPDPLTIKIESDLFRFTKEIEIAAESEKELILELDLDPNSLEGYHDLHITAITEEGEKYMDDIVPLKISKFDNIKEVSEQISGFLSWGENITESNQGNTIAERAFTKQFSGFELLFTSFTPEPEIVESENKKLAQWQYTLSPGEAKTFSYKTNYGTPLIILILVILVLALLYFTLRKPITVRKKVMALHSRQGKIAIMKVLIYVKNKRNKPLKSVSLIDKVPKSIRRPTQFSQDKPKVSSLADGTRLLWSLSLRPKQEKVISYRIESSIKVIGRIRLPKAIILVKTKNSRKVSKSNSAILKE